MCESGVRACVRETGVCVCNDEDEKNDKEGQLLPLEREKSVCVSDMRM